MLLSSGVVAVVLLLLLLFWRLFGQAAFNWKHSWVLAVGCDRSGPHAWPGGCRLHQS